MIRLVDNLFTMEVHLRVLHRIARFFYLRVPIVGKLLSKPVMWFMYAYTSCNISPRAYLGKGVRFPHPIGIVIGKYVQVGDDTKIWHGVTLGSHGRATEEMRFPVIGKRVRIFNGASIIGDVTIGDDAIIGAHSLVNIDVPPGATAVGVPARILPKS